MQISTHHRSVQHSVIPPFNAPATVVTKRTATPLTSSSSGSSSDSSSSEATITANDFLELLVTEMKNQDPTADTDPNEYINQLVQVNSLEQLIQINQDLGGSSAAGGSTDASATHGNLSANISSQSKVAQAAPRVADALERGSKTPPSVPLSPERYVLAPIQQNLNLQ